MYLAWKEITRNKSKFALIISLVVLITYLVYFLTSLAYGLASSYTNGINQINASELVLSNSSNENVMMSVLTEDDFNNLTVNGEKEKLGLFPAVVMNFDDINMIDSKEEVFVFGIENIEFFLPNKGMSNLVDYEIIVDDSMKDLGYQVGDTVIISGTDIKWKIVGFSKKTTYQTAPIVYVSLDSWREYRYNGAKPPIYNAILTKGNITNLPENLESLTIDQYISTLPGYTAQVLTFSMMIGFLIVIIAFVLGIFIYVLTIQKISMFGVMKAQGISSKYIGSSVINQTVIIVLFGSLIGFILAQTTGIFLAGIVPFARNYLFYGLISLGFVIFSILGGLFSVSAIFKIDPLEAIG